MKFLTRVANTPDGLECIKEMRKVAKTNGLKLVVYGRAKRKEAFAKTGRKYNVGRGGNGNNISLKSKEAPYCYEWVVYRHELPEERALHTAIWQKTYPVYNLAYRRQVQIRKPGDRFQ